MYKHSVAKLLPTIYVMNVFAQAQVTQYHEDFHTSYGFSYEIIYNQQIYLNKARSGFEPELPIHIITLLSETPVTEYFSKNLSRKFKFQEILLRIMGNSHEEQRIFVITSP